MSQKFVELVAMMTRLRKECPWDREQTYESMKKCILGEAQEVADAIDAGDMKNLQEEIGDLIMVCVLISTIAQEKKDFTLEDALRGIVDKMIRRHPHVYGDAKAETVEEALALFREAKKKEKQ